MNLMLQVMFPLHHFNFGAPTFFPEKIIDGRKRHTVRENYPHWKKHEGKRVNLCVWKGRAYNSKMMRFATAVLRVDEINMCSNRRDGMSVKLTDKNGLHSFHTLSDFARDDGLTEREFRDWFKDGPWEADGHACIWLDDLKEVSE